MENERPSPEGGRERRQRNVFDRINKLEAELNTSDPKTIIPLIDAYLLAGLTDNAVGLAEKYIKKGGTDKTIMVLLAQTQFNRFDLEQAEATLSALGSFVDGSSRAQCLLGELAQHHKKFNEAKAYFQKALKLEAHNSYAKWNLDRLTGASKVAFPPLPDHEGLEAASKQLVSELHREKLPRALKQIALLAVVLAAVLFYYKWSADKAFRAAQLVMEAQPIAELGDVESLRAGIATYMRVLEIDDDNAYALAGLAESYGLLWYDHGIEAERANAEKYLALAKDEGYKNANGYMAEGLVLLGSGRFEEARKMANDLLKRGLLAERIYFIQGMARWALGDLTGAAESLKRAADVNTKMPILRNMVGDVHYVMGEDRTMNFYWSRTEGNPKHIILVARQLITTINKGELTDQMEQRIAALEALPAELRGTKDDIAILWAKAELYLRELDYTKAEETIDAALKLAPEDVSLLDVKGRIYLAAEQPERATPAFQRAFAHNPTSKRFGYGLIAALDQSKKYDEALVVANSLEKDLKEDLVFLIKKGDLFRDKGDYEQALLLYNAALNLSDKYAPVHYALGYLNQVQKKFQQAADCYQKAAELRDRYPEVYRQMGVIYAELDDMPGANGWFGDAEKMFLQNRFLPPHVIKDFYQLVIDTFTSKGYKAARFLADWKTRAEKYKSAAAASGNQPLAPGQKGQPAPQPSKG